MARGFEKVAQRGSTNDLQWLDAATSAIGQLHQRGMLCGLDR